MAMITDEDGSEAEETVDEAKNLVQVSYTSTQHPQYQDRTFELNVFICFNASHSSCLEHRGRNKA